MGSNAADLRDSQVLIAIEAAPINPSDIGPIFTPSYGGIGRFDGLQLSTARYHTPFSASAPLHRLPVSRIAAKNQPHTRTDRQTSGSYLSDTGAAGKDGQHGTAGAKGVQGDQGG